MSYKDLSIEIDNNSLKNNDSLVIQLDTNKDDDIKYIDITKKNGKCLISLKTQSYAIKEAANVGKQKELFQNYLIDRFSKLNSKDQQIALQLMKKK